MSDITETPEAPPVEPEANLPYLIGVRLREPLQAEDHQTAMEDLHVGDFVVVETGQGTVVGEVRRPKRPLPEFKRGRLYRTVGTPLAQINGAQAQTGAADVGELTLTFTDGQNARLDYIVDGFAQTKSITRYVFGSPQTLCR